MNSLISLVCVLPMTVAIASSRVEVSPGGGDPLPGCAAAGGRVPLVGSLVG